MKKIKFVLIILLLVNSSCNKMNKIDNESLKKCVNLKVTESIKETFDKNYSADFYVLMNQVEKLLIIKGVLEDKSLDSYKKAFSEMSNNENGVYLNVFDELNHLLKDEKFGISFVNSYAIFKECPYYVLITEKNDVNSIIEKQFLHFSQMEIDGHYNINIIDDLINDTKLEKSSSNIYKAPITFLYIFNLTNKMEGFENREKVKFE